MKYVRMLVTISIICVALISSLTVPKDAGADSELKNTVQKMGTTECHRHAKTLWRHKVEYIGNASQVVKLASLVFGNEFGTRTHRLQTQHKPYGVIISFSETTQEFLTLDGEKKLLTLLALIHNAGYVTVEHNADIYQLSVEEASHHLGYNIKDLYESERKYLQFEQDVCQHDRSSQILLNE